MYFFVLSERVRSCMNLNFGLLENAVSLRLENFVHSSRFDAFLLPLQQTHQATTQRHRVMKFGAAAAEAASIASSPRIREVQKYPMTDVNPFRGSRFQFEPSGHHNLN